ncbi:MAG: MFS transporter, partial [Deltaproteobacteria bacterium]|nr:MFS transporter [Deltaproteobacteria bacterium]
NITRMFGPLLAGVLVAALGVRWCFTLNGLSYIPVIWGLAAMRIKPFNKRQREDKTVLKHIAEGVRYTRKHLVIFRILVLSTFVCMIACPYIVLLPVFGLTVLGGSAYTLSWLNGMLGAGAILATLLFTGVHDTQLIKLRLIRDVMFWGLGLIMLGMSHNLYLSLGAMFTIGFFMMSVFPTMNNAIQQMVDDSMRGRVMSLYTMTFLGTMPFGSLAMGWLSDRYTAPVVVTGAGMLTMAMGIGLVFRNTVRHRLRDVASGIRNT